MMGSEGISVADAIALGRGNNGYGDGDGAFGGYSDGGYGNYNDGSYGRRGVPGSGRGHNVKVDAMLIHGRSE